MDLVVGATGAVGKQITLQLLEEKRKMRALIRGGRERAEAKPFLDLGAEIADGDLTAPDTPPHAPELTLLFAPPLPCLTGATTACGGWTTMAC